VLFERATVCVAIRRAHYSTCMWFHNNVRGQRVCASGLWRSARQRCAAASNNGHTYIKPKKSAAYKVSVSCVKYLTVLKNNHNQTKTCNCCNYTAKQTKCRLASPGPGSLFAMLGRDLLPLLLPCSANSIGKSLRPSFILIFIPHFPTNTSTQFTVHSSQYTYNANL